MLNWIVLKLCHQNLSGFYPHTGRKITKTEFYLISCPTKADFCVKIRNAPKDCCSIAAPALKSAMNTVFHLRKNKIFNCIRQQLASNFFFGYFEKMPIKGFSGLFLCLFRQKYFLDFL